MITVYRGCEACTTVSFFSATNAIIIFFGGGVERERKRHPLEVFKGVLGWMSC